MCVSFNKTEMCVYSHIYTCIYTKLIHTMFCASTYRFTWMNYVKFYAQSTQWSLQKKISQNSPFIDIPHPTIIWRNAKCEHLTIYLWFAYYFMHDFSPLEFFLLENKTKVNIWWDIKIFFWKQVNIKSLLMLNHNIMEN